MFFVAFLGIYPVNRTPTLTVLISGRGSNLIALHERASNYRIGLVISSNSAAQGLVWAAQAGVPSQVVERGTFPSLAAFKAGVLDAVLRSQPDVVALAGFMVVLQPEFSEAFGGRLINIHPSLLPRLPGLDTHQRAIASGETEHGCTVHFVDSGVDTGPRIAQGVVPVLPGDDAAALAARTLAVEHSLYPWVTASLVRGGVQLAEGRVRYDAQAVREAHERGFRIFV